MRKTWNLFCLAGLLAWAPAPTRAQIIVQCLDPEIDLMRTPKSVATTFSCQVWWLTEARKQFVEYYEIYDPEKTNPREFARIREAVRKKTAALSAWLVQAQIDRTSTQYEDTMSDNERLPVPLDSVSGKEPQGPPARALQGDVINLARELRDLVEWMVEARGFFGKNGGKGGERANKESFEAARGRGRRILSDLSIWLEQVRINVRSTEYEGPPKKEGLGSRLDLERLREPFRGL